MIRKFLVANLPPMYFGNSCGQNPGISSKEYLPLFFDLNEENEDLLSGIEYDFIYKKALFDGSEARHKIRLRKIPANGMITLQLTKNSLEEFNRRVKLNELCISDSIYIEVKEDNNHRTYYYDYIISTNTISFKKKDNSWERQSDHFPNSVLENLVGRNLNIYNTDSNKWETIAIEQDGNFWDIYALEENERKAIKGKSKNELSFIELEVNKTGILIRNRNLRNQIKYHVMEV